MSTRYDASSGAPFRVLPLLLEPLVPLLLLLRPEVEPLLEPSLRTLPFVPELLPEVPLPPDEPELEPLLPEEPDEPLPPFLARAGENAAPASKATAPADAKAARTRRLDEHARMVQPFRRSPFIAHLSQFVSGLSATTCYMLATVWMLT